jgi:hypothetical protein
MRKLFLLFLLLPFIGKAQIQQNKIITSANLNIHSQNVFGETNSKFKVTLGSKTGKFFFDSSWALGINWALTYQHSKVYKLSSIQINGSKWYEKGGGNAVYGSFGFFADKYFKLRSGLYVSLSQNLSYYWGEFVEQTEVVDENGNNAGIIVRSYDYTPTRLQYLFYPSLTYFITKKHAINCSIGTLNVGLVGKHPETNTFLEEKPVLDIQLLFPSIGFGYTLVF